MSEKNLECDVVWEDRMLLEEMKRKAASVTHVTSTNLDSDYVDVYIVVLKDRIPYVVLVRNICKEVPLAEESQS